MAAEQSLVDGDIDLAALLIDGDPGCRQARFCAISHPQDADHLSVATLDHADWREAMLMVDRAVALGWR